MKLATHLWGELLAGAGVGWVVDSNDDSLEALAERLNAELDEVQLVLDAALGQGGVDVGALVMSDPEDMRAVIQTFASPMGANIRAAATLAALGYTILSIEVSYVHQSSFVLSVTVSGEDGTPHTFQSSDIWDAEALRHFGIMKVGDRPVLHGYLSFRAP